MIFVTFTLAVALAFTLGHLYTLPPSRYTRRRTRRWGE
jgi:hypothetical protein